MESSQKLARGDLKILLLCSVPSAEQCHLESQCSNEIYQGAAMVVAVLITEMRKITRLLN